ncbi:MAG TPA: UDP-N-acetylglucosamine diphosphorylase/glucosamine-1-phosphate N-acetyltransferase, partial [Thiotrichales bacterium]|nr:UDP-N-acetylglucosamine diphosphorylase/glucosamine-1-phosphate N-acetyltransferase [Thiotrichales bacterium]
HKIAGTAMVEHVYRRSDELAADSIHIVYGHGGEQVREQCAHFRAQWHEQSEQLGTAHAVEQASPALDDDSIALVLYGDVPLIRAATLKQLVGMVEGDDIALLTVNLDDPTGYGRIVRENGQVTAIVEQKDASEEQRKITEVNTGILAIRAGYLNACLKKIENNNAQGEYYLTDVIAMAVNEGNRVVTAQPENAFEVEGVNDRKQLAKLERIYQREQASVLMADGVTLADPSRIDVRGELNIGNDSFIDINCIFEGEVNIGTNVHIGAGCIIRNSTIVCDSTIKPYSIIEDANVGKRVEVGPFARLRPGAELKQDSRVGNFVEVKNTVLGENSKASHLTYLGDSDIGRDVNIGAGTITCNYDGANKFRTVIEDGAFIGSDSQLVAPVTIGKNATVGAGSTITRDTQADTLTLSRSVQKSIKGWKRPQKKQA